MLESAWGACTAHVLQGWDVPHGVDWDSAADRMPANPDVWTDGSLVRDEIFGPAFAGYGFMLACMLITGGTGVGVMLMILVLLLMVWLLLVGVLVLCLDLFRLFRGLSCGCHSGFASH